MTAPRLSLIVAVAQNGVIGRDNDLPWRLPDDMVWFRAKTMGHHVIMGRKTYLSLGGHPLPGRTKIVLSRDPAFSAPDAIVRSGLAAAVELAAAAGDDEAFVIGGRAVYAEALPIADRIYLTRVQADVEGDVTFPALGANWHEVSREDHDVDDRHRHPFSWCVLERADSSQHG